MRSKSFTAAIIVSGLMTSSVFAVSVGELSRDCGEDAKTYCKGVGYGDPMQACLAANSKKLQPQCKAIMVRLEGGEKVTLF